MQLCVLAKIVLLLAIVSAVFHVCSLGITIRLLADLLFMALLVFITNLYCDSWIAKGIVIFAIIGTVMYMFSCSTNRKINQQTIENDKEKNRR